MEFSKLKAGRYILKIKLIFIILSVFACFIPACASIEPAKDVNKAAKLLLQEVENDVTKDNQSPLKDYIPQLEDIIEYTEKVINKETPYDDEMIAERIEKLKEIRINYKKMVVEILKNDVSFRPGKWDIDSLHSGGKELLSNAVEKIINTILKESKAKYPDKNITILITTVGHADEQPPTGKLADYLDNIIKNEGKYSSDGEEMRKERNRVLSYLRAKTVMNYLKDQLNRRVDDPDISIKERKIVGLGEELPPNGENGRPFSPRDRRRRVCRLFGNIRIIAE